MTRFDIVRRAILADAGPLSKFAATAAMVGLATLLAIAARGISVSVPIVPFAPYYPAVLLAALFMGWRWAIGAMFASMPIVARLFLAPAMAAGLVSATWERYLLFTFACLVLIWVGDTLRRTFRQMDRISHERDLLAREMLHRVGNTLTVVDALVRLANKDLDAEQFARELSGRIRALAKANQLVLKSSGGEAAEVSQLLADATRPFATRGAFRIAGPETWLPDNAAHYLMLIVHELSTNALKHGALSSASGTVEITWADGEHGFDLEWRELGGPPVREPERRGLGMRLLKMQSIFEATVRFQPEGLSCNLRLRRQLPVPSQGANVISTTRTPLAAHAAACQCAR